VKHAVAQKALALRRSALAFAVGYCVAFVACQKPGTEVCPSGRLCPAGSHCAAAQDICITTPCGNGKVDPGEACDDGNVLDGDVDPDGHCNSICTSDEECGNGHVDRHMGENCDPAANGSLCRADCKALISCGNGLIDAREECDPGGLDSTASCNANCTHSRHGDGRVNPADEGEECDGDGHENLTTVAGHVHGDYCEFVGTVGGELLVCNARCKRGWHGDGVVNPSYGEQCDRDVSLAVPAYAPTTAGCESRTCTADCRFSWCGDGVTNPTAGEECDDGNRDDTDDCTNRCRWNVCGDGIPHRTHSPRYADAPPYPLEPCDLGSANQPDPDHLASCDYGQATCEFCVRVSASECRTATSTGPSCGDDHVDPGETCDNPVSRQCGTCDPVACTRIDAANATGTIEVFDANHLDGASIFLADGLGSTRTVYFDSTGACAADVCIDPTRAQSLADLALEIQQRFASFSPALSVTVSAVSATVHVENTEAGFDGNVAIVPEGGAVTTAPASGSVVVSGMSGGRGCSLTQACAFDRDCVSSRCVNGSCRKATGP
jgi:hypothetical protein